MEWQERFDFVNPKVETLRRNMAEASQNGASPPERKKTRDDFRFGPVLGEGSYSTVILAEEKSSKREFAIKVIRKYHIIKEKKTRQVCTSNS